jgi:ribosomal peptide maturation radical SAM protein 1
MPQPSPTLISTDALTRPERAPVPLKVALVNMPFASSRYPSIQLGLLHAILTRRGHDARTYYFNLPFAASLGWETYELICRVQASLLGEWLFAGEAFGEWAPAPQSYLDRFAEDVQRAAERTGRDPAFFLDLRERVIPSFLQECLNAVAWDQYDVVGFGSVFEQNCAALALARLIKQRHPDVAIVFGGSNFEDEMGLEYVRGVPWIDYAVIGEGDEVFPALLDRIAAGEDIDGMPGVARRLPDGTVSFGGRAPMVRNLDALPEPEYGEFFRLAQQLELPRLTRGLSVVLPFETARGCWWGQKHHCTFCGLNGAGMAYRSKSPARALAGIDELAERYNVYAFEAVDNILDLRYIRDVFGPIVEQRKDYTFFYEVKANLNVDQLRELARGGVRQLQPGIESLNTHILKLMDKGTTGIQNVRLLKWARYYGIQISWNVLAGFPGERAEDFERQLEVMRLVPHLQPPSGIARIWLERYSPYFMKRDEMGITNIRAKEVYRYVYPPMLDAEQIAYFFDYDAANTVSDEAYEATSRYIESWQEAWKTADVPYLTYQRGAGRLIVVDGREVGQTPRVHLFDEHAARVYEFCGPTSHGAAQILEDLRRRGTPADSVTVQRDLDRFVELGLMLEEEGHYLSLALPANPNW